MPLSALSALAKENTWGCLFLAAIVLTAAAYAMGLPGVFLLDDFQNLKFLERIGDASSPGAFAANAFSGITGGIGRPVSVLSFSLQHHAWPGSPQDFKYVNLLLHLLNGCLLFWLLLSVGKLAGLARSIAVAAGALTASLWLLHPMQVSTVLYVVQRMVELSALFTLAGLIAYVHGRQCLLRGEGWKGYAWLSLGLGLGGVLATMSKENGILLPLYALILEATLFRAIPQPRYWKVWAAVFLLSPLLLLLGYFSVYSSLLGGYQIRDFTLGERLLTEARVLMDYLGKLFFPRPQQFGLFHDDYPISRGLLDPPQTVAAVAAVLGLLAVAWRTRHRFAPLSFGIFWFFGGHALESTVLPLEIYFEHRNYLPMVGPLYAAVWYGMQWQGRAKAAFRYLIPVAATLFLALMVSITWQETRLWGQPALQVVTWAEERPHSVRAQEALATLKAASGEYEKAAGIYARMSGEHVQDTGAYLLWLQLGCFDDKVALPGLGQVLGRLKEGAFSFAPLGALDGIVTLREKGKCRRLAYGDIVKTIETLIQNPHYQGHLINLHFPLGRLHASEGLLSPAVEALDKGYAISPRADIALLQVRWLASAGLYDDALRYVALARAANAQHALTGQIYEAQINNWESALRRVKNPDAGR